MRKYLQEYLKNYAYDAEAETTFLAAFDRIGAQALTELCDLYTDEPDFRFEVLTEKIEKIVLETGVNKFAAYFVGMVFLLRKLGEFYAKRGYPETVFDGACRDLVCKYRECRAVKETAGIFAWDWYECFLKLRCFAIGRLQFEMKGFRLPEYAKDGKTVHFDETVLSVHIPSSGRLLKEDCDRSYQAAVEFFSKYFADVFPKDYITFVCWSWLLYTRNSEILPAGSNIFTFMEKYDIIEIEEYSKEVSDLMACERVFGIPDLNREIPQKTAMQKSVYAFMQKGGLFGWGYGVFFLSK